MRDAISNRALAGRQFTLFPLLDLVMYKMALLGRSNWNRNLPGSHWVTSPTIRATIGNRSRTINFTMGPWEATTPCAGCSRWWWRRLSHSAVAGCYRTFENTVCYEVELRCVSSFPR